MVISARRDIFNKHDDNYCFIMDNASIHKSALAVKYYKKLGTRILTLSPYSPSQNPVEKMINAIRQKTKKKYLEGM